MRILRSVFIGLLLGVLLSIILLFIFSLRYDREISRYVFTAIDKRIEPELYAEDIQVQLLRHFPFASVNLNNSALYSPQKQDTLLKAENLIFKFDLISFLTSNYLVEEIRVENASVKLVVNEYGELNFRQILQTQGSPTDSFSLDLQAVQFHKTNISYENRQQDFLLEYSSDHSSLSGNFKKSEIDLQTDLNGEVLRFTSGKINYSNTTLDGHFEMKSADHELLLAGEKFKLGGIRLNFSGSYFQLDKKLHLQYQSEGQQAKKLQHLISPFLREAQKKIAVNKGDYLLQGTVDYQRRGNPALQIHTNFYLHNLNGNLSLSHPFPFKHLMATGRLSFSPGNISCKLDSFQIQSGDSKLKGDLYYDQKNNQAFYLNTTGNVQLQDITQISSLDSLIEASGQMTLKASYKGNLNHFLDQFKTSLKHNTLPMNLDFKDANIRFKNRGITIRNINGKITKERQIKAEQLYFEAGKNDFRIDGTIRLLPFYSINARLYSNSISINELQLLFSEENRQAPQSLPEFPDSLYLNLQFDVENLTAGKFKGERVRGNFNYKPKMISLNQISFDGFGGNTRMNGVIVQKLNREIDIHGRTHFQELNIDEVFTSLNNFGQEYLIDKNLKGTISGDLHVSAQWDRNLKINPESLNAQSNISIENGELINFEPMMGLSRFIAVEELKHIRFSTLKNEISIQNQEIIIPLMDIESSAFNISGSGKHRFDNAFSYRLKVYLSEVLSREADIKKGSSFGAIEDDGLGRTAVFLAIEGTPDDYKVRYDRKRAMDNFRDKMKEEKKSLKQILNEEFGWFDKDSSKKEAPQSDLEKSRQQKKKSKAKKDTTQQFIIEWEEDSTSF